MSLLSSRLVLACTALGRRNISLILTPPPELGKILPVLPHDRRDRHARMGIISRGQFIATVCLVVMAWLHGLMLTLRNGFSKYNTGFP